ncbi:MBL fold metallo-hydrolase [Azoarcus olearius]|uniref:Beta lactamase n=1 Tax=Azoarcus sp. (strain BH72) TaxID=418699 RepID=A1K2G0_AZOSB|nr:MBL fold metallo-hydrolase [Azoarcus olearius]ANQ83486.1 putative beta lactamase [Azoarcus olearius]CAL93015.1 putative beta lactamase [Azoarcus olearius]
MSAPRLPASVQVFERGWLSANNVVLDDGGEVTLIDSGYVTHAAQTLALVAGALGGRRLAQLINTHSHSDHIGGNAAVQRAFGGRIVVPAGMADAVERWDEDALLLRTADQRGERFAHDAVLTAGDRFIAGGLEWQALPAAGHDMDALAFYNAERRILVSGDALWRDGFGILFADVLGRGDALGAARETLEAFGRLAVDVVIPGHGAPFADVDGALERAFARLAAFEADGARMARNAIRACITFRLLEHRRLALDDLAAHLDATPLYRSANARFLGLEAQALADWLVAELLRAGVARREGETLVPA